jgi:GH35 family endo-1,4-beta-xylanase
VSLADESGVNPKLKHRMATLVVKTGAGASVAVKQQKHEFWFGTAISSRMFTGRVSAADKKKYLEVLKENFNSAVHENAMKWYSTEKSKGKITYKNADVMVQWCMDNGLRVRGHCVFWAVDNYVQDWIKKLDDQALRKKVESRAIDLITHYRGKVSEFDVNNEMVHGRFFAGRLGDSIRKEMFVWCKKANPDAVLYVNDYGILSGGDLGKYEKQIDTLLKQGAPIGGIGLQGHFGKSVNRKKIKQVLDRLSRYKLPIKITEFDIKNLDENAKAKGLKDLYEVCFEHPSVDGILMWGFWANSHWLSSKKYGIKGYTALWDKDWNPMPAAKVYRDLVFRKWWTDFKGTADNKGVCEIKVFLGQHKITAGGKEQVINLTKPETRTLIDIPVQHNRE